MKHKAILVGLVLFTGASAACGGDEESSGASTETAESNGTTAGEGATSNTTNGTAGSTGATASNTTMASNTTTANNDTTGNGTSNADCLADVFIQPEAHPNNTDYPDPQVQAYCEGDELVVESNGIIGYEFVPITPGNLRAMEYTWRIPINPEVADTVSDVPLLGTLGFTVTGLPIFGPNEGPPYGDPYYNMLLDSCLGHIGPSGYHLHALLMSCIVGYEGSTDEESPILGFASDGFPIYGSYGCVDDDCTEIVEHESGWVQTGDPATNAWDNHTYMAQPDNPAVLDQCNGHFGPEGYHYHATAGFPYVLGCYKGAVANADGDGMMEGGGMMEDGGMMEGGDGMPMCDEGQTAMCCGDGVCDGPETAETCPSDC